MSAAGRVAVVTGAARGIGAATVLRLAAAGWSVVAVDIAADDPAIRYPLGTPEELAAVVSRAGESAVAHIADVRDTDGLAAAVELAESRFGGLDAAIAVAGVIGGGAPHWQTDPDTERAIVEVDIAGAMRLARVAVPALLRRPEPRSGRFLAVSSAAATRGLPHLAAYCAAKAGVVGFVRALAAELARTGVTANVVSPGSTRTKILDASAALYTMDSVEQFGAQQPIDRLIEPDEVARMLEFLAAPDSGAVTGAEYLVDGGMTV